VIKDYFFRIKYIALLISVFSRTFQCDRYVSVTLSPNTVSNLNVCENTFIKNTPKTAIKMGFFIVVGDRKT